VTPRPRFDRERAYLMVRKNGYLIDNAAAAAVVAREVSRLRDEAAQFGKRGNPEVQKELLETAQNYAAGYLDENDSINAAAKDAPDPGPVYLAGIKAEEESWRPLDPEAYDVKSKELLAAAVARIARPTPTPSLAPLPSAPPSPSATPALVPTHWERRPWAVPPAPVAPYPFQPAVSVPPGTQLPPQRGQQPQQQGQASGGIAGPSGVLWDTWPCVFCRYSADKILNVSWLASSYCPAQRSLVTMCLAVLDSVDRTWRQFQQGKNLWIAHNAFAGDVATVCSAMCAYRTPHEQAVVSLHTLPGNWPNSNS
jgi:hypothetical protein